MSCNPHERLVRLLLARGGAGCRFVASRGKPWASITFEGMRHVIDLEIPEDEAARFADGIGEIDFDLRGHFIADLVIVEQREPIGGLVALCIEALTLAGA